MTLYADEAVEFSSYRDFRLFLRQDKLRQDEATEKHTQIKTRQDRTTQDKTRQDRTGQDKARQDTTVYVSCMMYALVTLT